MRTHAHTQHQTVEFIIHCSTTFKHVQPVLWWLTVSLFFCGWVSHWKWNSPILIQIVWPGKPPTYTYSPLPMPPSFPLLDYRLLSPSLASYIGTGNPNSGSHACPINILPTKPSQWSSLKCLLEGWSFSFYVFRSLYFFFIMKDCFVRYKNPE